MLPAGRTMEYSCLLSCLRISMPNCFPSTRTAGKGFSWGWGVGVTIEKVSMLIPAMLGQESQVVGHAHLESSY